MQKNVLACIGAVVFVSNIYGATVVIVNKTEERVVARVNNQRRSSTFPKATGKFRKMMLMRIEYVLAYPVAERTAQIRAAIGVPNFIPINSRDAIAVTTVISKSIRGPGTGEIKEGKGMLSEGSGRPIRSITFARVKEHKVVTGTLWDLALSKQIKELNKKYGNIKVSRKERQYRDDLSGTSKKLEGKRGHTFSIKVPIMEEFTYTLPKGEKIRRAEKGKVVLKSWGKAERVKD